MGVDNRKSNVLQHPKQVHQVNNFRLKDIVSGGDESFRKTNTKLSTQRYVTHQQTQQSNTQQNDLTQGDLGNANSNNSSGLIDLNQTGDQLDARPNKFGQPGRSQ